MDIYNSTPYIHFLYKYIVEPSSTQLKLDNQQILPILYFILDQYRLYIQTHDIHIIDGREFISNNIFFIFVYHNGTSIVKRKIRIAPIDNYWLIDNVLFYPTTMLFIILRYFLNSTDTKVYFDKYNNTDLDYTNWLKNIHDIVDDLDSNYITQYLASNIVKYHCNINHVYDSFYLFETFNSIPPDLL